MTKPIAIYVILTVFLFAARTLLDLWTLEPNKTTRADMLGMLARALITSFGITILFTP